MSSSEESLVTISKKNCCSDQLISKKKRITRKEIVKCELVEYDSLPDYLKDNEFIVGHYRSEWPMKETILSIFSIHNETLNVWTHLIGFLIFLSLTVFTAMLVPKDWTNTIGVTRDLEEVEIRELTVCLPSSLPEEQLQDSFPSTEQMMTPSSSWRLPELLMSCLPKRFSLDNNLTNSCSLTSVKEDMDDSNLKGITRWPFFAFLSGAMFCLLTSSVCHLVSCHSERMAYTMLRLDYTGISALIVTSFYPVVYYSFMCHPFYYNLYMGFITTFGVATILASLVPVFQTAEYRTVRAVLFFCMGFSGLVPIVHKLIAFNDRPEVILSTGYELLMGIFYGLGVVVYATRVPERWMPGKFDLVGHSHQLFHLLVIAGAYTHYLAGLVYLKWRTNEGCH